MGMAINAVKEGRADAAVSGGNTGALMAMSKLALRTMPGIDRPALAALLPTLGETDCVMLDLGANTECDAQNLVQFAVMGAAYARTVLGIAKPRVKLLNIGTEELKGTDELKEAAGTAPRSRLSAAAVRRLHRRRQAVARRCRRRRYRRLLRQHRAEDRRGHGALRHRPAAPRLHELASLEGRLRAVAARAQPAQGPPRSEQPQRRGLPRPQRPGREEPRRRQRQRASPTRSASPRGMVRNDITRKIADDLDNFRAHAFANEAAQ